MANSQSGTRYIFNIINGQVKRARITGTLLSILAVIIFLTRYFRDLSFLNLIVAVLILLLVAWNLLIRKKQNRIPDFILLLFIGISLILIPLFNLMGALYLLLAYISFRLSKPANIQFSDEAVILQSLWRNSYPWEQVRHVVLKDNIISVELRNDKFIQFEIEDVPLFNDDEFKNFITEKIIKESD